MPNDHLQALPNGHRIDEFEIIRVLGAGGFGITYLAFDHNLHAPVAIKEYFYAGLVTRTAGGAVVPSSAGETEGFEWGRARFLDEARLLARLDHPNVVRVHRCIEANNTAYIVMDYVEGESLAVVLEKHGILAPPEWRRWMEPLLDGLEYVHRRDYLHRDMKPANIVIRAADGEPVLIDFGSARSAASEKTRHLTAVHTPGYAPIEQYSASSRQGSATDIYGLVAVSYRVLTGERPPGVAQDYSEAARWYRQAADQGNARAQLAFGNLYYQGRGVPEDHVSAHMWFNLATARATGELRRRAVARRDSVARPMTPGQIEAAQRRAREWRTDIDPPH